MKENNQYGKEEAPESRLKWGECNRPENLNSCHFKTQEKYKRRKKNSKPSIPL